MYLNVSNNINYYFDISCLNYFENDCILKKIISLLLFSEIVFNINALHINTNINLAVFREKN